MNKSEAQKTLEGSFVYLVDCTLATVDHLAMIKNKTKSEYKRQKAIAQFGVDQIVKFGIDPSTTRAEDVINKFSGQVEDYAIDIERRFK